MSEDKQNPEEHEDVSFYQKMADRTAELMADGRRTVEEALNKAGEELSAGGEYTKEQAEKIGEYLRRDLQQLNARAKQAGDKVYEALEPHRVAAGVQSGLAKLLRSAADVLTGMADKSEQVLEVKTGEVTSPGTLTCTACGKEVHLKTTAKIPPCPHCHKTVFRKSY